MSLTKKTLLLLAAVSLATPGVSSALDIGSIIGNAASRAVTNSVSSTTYSITTASIGRAVAGATRPVNTEGKVLLYRTATCGYCKKAAAYMTQRQIPFVERDIEADATARQEYDSYGIKGVPVLVFGSETLKGFKESRVDELYARMQKTGGATPAAAATTPAIAGLAAGDVLRPKINNIFVMSEPDKKSERLGKLARAESVVYMGDDTNGYYRVTTSLGEGWVDKLLVDRP